MEGQSWRRRKCGNTFSSNRYSRGFFSGGAQPRFQTGSSLLYLCVPPLGDVAARRPRNRKLTESERGKNTKNKKKINGKLLEDDKKKKKKIKTLTLTACRRKKITHAVVRLTTSFFQHVSCLLLAADYPTSKTLDIIFLHFIYSTRLFYLWIFLPLVACRKRTVFIRVLSALSV